MRDDRTTDETLPSVILDPELEAEIARRMGSSSSPPSDTVPVTATENPGGFGDGGLSPDEAEAYARAFRPSWDPSPPEEERQPAPPPSTPHTDLGRDLPPAGAPLPKPPAARANRGFWALLTSLALLGLLLLWEPWAEGPNEIAPEPPPPTTPQTASGPTPSAVPPAQPTPDTDPTPPASVGEPDPGAHDIAANVPADAGMPTEGDSALTSPASDSKPATDVAHGQSLPETTELKRPAPKPPAQREPPAQKATTPRTPRAAPQPSPAKPRSPEAPEAAPPGGGFVIDNPY